MASKKKMTMGLIVGNRGFFPDHLAKTGREEMLQTLQNAGFAVVALTPEQSKYGAVGTHEEAKRCAELFRSKDTAIDGVIVTLPNFGDERAIADTLRLARLNVPVLIQATPDTPAKMGITHRRDSFCGKMSACNNLKQYGIPYSLTTLHTETPTLLNSPGISNGSPRSVASSKVCAISASGHSARAPPRSTPCATARSFSKPAASLLKPSISPKSSAASAA